jgi:hypothetical protein
MRIYLRTDDKDSMDALLESAGIEFSAYQRYSIIGPIPDGDQRWHLNLLLLDDPDEALLELLEPFRVYPETPYRVYG